MKNAISVCLLVLLIANMSLIFYNSSKDSTSSSSVSKDVTDTLLTISKKVGPGVEKELSRNQIKVVHHMLRKSGHILEFCSLGFLSVLLALINLKNPKEHFRFAMLMSFVFTVLYAASDELHQMFVSGRSSSVADMLLDCSGSSAGVILGCCLFLVFTVPSKLKKYNNKY